MASSGMVHYAPEAPASRARTSMTPPNSPPSKHSPVRSAVLWILKIGVSVGLLYVLFARIDAGETWAHMRSASVGWVATALGLYTLVIVVGAVRWQLLLRTQHVDIPFTTLVNSYLAASFANNFLPSNIGGDVIRIADTARASRHASRDRCHRSR